LNSPYTVGFALSMLIVNFFSYSGGTWNLAARFISSSSSKEARKAGILSAMLYLIWPLILLFPMFVAPLFLPALSDPTQSYGIMAMKFLPNGLIGLVLASMFANTLSMTSSDSNTVSAVITRDILPVVFPRIKHYSSNKSLLLARITTFTFTLLTLLVAINSDNFGGVFGLIVSWFAALLGPISVPMILGLLKLFNRSGSSAALLSIMFGLGAFIITKLIPDLKLSLEVGVPILTSLFIFILVGFLKPENKQ
jgi:solute:Na+ symporter, SSS family